MKKMSNSLKPLISSFYGAALDLPGILSILNFSVIFGFGPRKRHLGRTAILYLLKCFASMLPLSTASWRLR